MLAKAVDFFGDPGNPVKHPEQVEWYNILLTRLNPGNFLAEYVNETLFEQLTPLVKRLNEEKYKKDGLPPGAVIPDKEELQELQVRYENKQKELS
jgi:hypothetical protein